MDLQQIIAQAGGLEAIAGQLGISPEQASSGISALLPAVLGGFKKSVQGQPDGVGSMLGMLQAFGGGGLVDNVVGSEPTQVEAGNNILGQIFGSKDVSRTVAAHAASQTGVDSGILQKMLPMVAMLAAGYMAKSSSGGGLGDMLGGMLGGGAQAGGGLGGMLGSVLGGGAQGGGLGGLLGGMLGGGGQPAAAAATPAAGGLGGLMGMLDMDGDGNPLDDILGMAGKLTGR